MTPDIILIIAGCLLLLIGLVGGGVTSTYATVGKVDGNIARTLCVIIGFVLIGIGVGLKIWPQLPHPDPSATKQEPKTLPQNQPEVKQEPKPPTPTPQPTKEEPKTLPTQNDQTAKTEPKSVPAQSKASPTVLPKASRPIQRQQAPSDTTPVPPHRPG